MSKELKGENGKTVGTMNYFNENNVGSIIGKIINKYNFNYYSSIQDLSKKCIKMFDEIYS